MGACRTSIAWLFFKQAMLLLLYHKATDVFQRMVFLLDGGRTSLEALGAKKLF